MALKARRGGAAQGERQRQTAHEGFLSHRSFLWLKIGVVLSLAAIVGYWLADVSPRPGGGTWYGYTLGTIGALIIIWLSLLGIRKRAMTSGAWSLKAWTSAHVYLGLSLIIIGTLHSAFDFGWNIHTYAYVLMLLVIASGIWGISAYATLPAALSNNREERTQAQMLEDIRSLDRQLYDAALTLPPPQAALVRDSLDQDPFAGSIIARLTGKLSNCATARAKRELGGYGQTGTALEKVDALLGRKQGALTRLRRHLKIKALLEIWLYIHVPLTFALLAALSAHIISVFFYW